MPVSHEHKIIFVHIPRTAGESIENCLGMYGGDPIQFFWGAVDNFDVLQHNTARELKLKIHNDALWDEYTKFSVVRNPFSKTVSEYHWYLRYGPHCSFEDWVISLENRIAINRNINIAEIGHNMPQNSFLLDEHKQLMMDKIIKFENLEEEFTDFLLAQDIVAVLPPASTTKSQMLLEDFRDYYDENTAEIVEKIYREDLSAFSYDKAGTFG
ncbi:MAG: sulfotransferase family 2 domain-containing protein [Halioglobus sp.]|nr:sulfotransferase family 2 domain-containing protein [Halioglobus sp.]